MIAATAFGRTLVLGEPLPQCCLRADRHSVRAYPCYSQPFTRVGATLALLKKEVETALRPQHLPVTLRQPLFASKRILELRKSLVEAYQVRETVGLLANFLSNHWFCFPIANPFMGITTFTPICCNGSVRNSR